MGYLIAGVQQVGIGCMNLETAWKWYIDMFGVDVRVLEDDTVAERMLPYTGGQAQKRHAAIAINLQGGGGFEIWQYSNRQPKPADFQVAAGDLGVFACKVKSQDPKAFREQLLKKYDKIGPLTKLPDGSECFYLVDPWGNYFQIIKDDYIFINEHRLNGGVVGAVIGCTDIEKTQALYRELFGYDKVVYDVTDEFEDMAFMEGGNGKFRRILLTHTETRKGSCAKLYGTTTIELVQALDRTPRKIYEGRYWGDPGFIQICFDVINMNDLKKKCAEVGHPFTVDSCPNDEHFDMGEASGRFAYIEDPDGSLIELVETHKATVLKHPHITINLHHSDPNKTFPKLFFRLMGLFRVKF